MKNKQRVIYIRPCSYHVDFLYRPGSSQARKPFVHVNWWLFGSSTRVCVVLHRGHGLKCSIGILSWMEPVQSTLVGK
jgi:hypothetical protein